jgi:hypothetical protein
MVSFGNYDAEGRNRMSYPAETTEGETVQIVKKETVDASSAHASTILTAADGRTFAPAKTGGLIEEITAIVEEGVETVVEEVKEVVEEVVDRVQDALGMDDDNESETPAA